MQALVIDLRDNPGGVLDTVVKMLDYITFGWADCVYRKQKRQKNRV